MSSVHEQISEQFSRWEKRGRGWQIFEEPVSPEPPFRPFILREPQRGRVIDDGRRPTVLSSFVQKLSWKLNTEPPAPPVIQDYDDEPERRLLIRDSLIELQVTLPTDLDTHKDTIEQFLLNLFSCREPIAFELLGTAAGVRTQFVAHPDDASHVLRELQAYVPDAVFQSRKSELETTWDACVGQEILIVEFGLGREFMFPIATGKFDAFVGLIGVLAELQIGELGLFQVLFEPVSEAWSEHIIRAVSDGDGRPLFINAPELVEAAQEKTAKPLYGAVVRVAVKSERFERTLQIARDLASSLRVFGHPQGNELIPLTNDDYQFEEHVEDVLRRQSHRSGMLLNSDELIGLVHLPSSAIRSPAFLRQTGKTKPAPGIVQQEKGLLLGINEHAGHPVSVRLTPEQRVRHCHIIGASGTGKSTLLFNLIYEGIQTGEGLAVLDPHGDLIDRICGIIPAERVDDVVLVDPSDIEYSVGFNILSAHSDVEKNLLASDLVAVFQRLSTSWGDQMNSVLQNAILAFLESERGGTVADLRRFLIEPAFRTDFLKSVKDSEVVYYWQKSFPHLLGNKSIGSLLTRLDLFLAQKPIRYMVSQPENRLDFASIMDTGKIFLAKLPEGLLGRENSYLLGALLVSKFQQIVMSRQAQQITARRDFWLYIDEFANFITPSMGEILSGARKYRIGLTLAHHELHQLKRDPDVASAVMSHPFTRIVFRVGDADAKELAAGFSYFGANDFRNLETGHAICRVERSDYDFNLHVPLRVGIDAESAAARRQEVITASRKKYGRLRTEVEAVLAQSRVPTTPDELPKATGSGKEKVGTSSVEAKSQTPVTEVSKPPVVVTAKPEVDGTPQPPPDTLPVVPQIVELPKISETTVSAEKAVAPTKTAAPRDLGRGGAQHKAIQERIQAEAHALGFLATVEGQLAGTSNEAADLLLRKGTLVIAVEITITTTIDHEFGNVKKCLAAGFAKIAVISPKAERLEAIREAVKAGLGSAMEGRISYHTPDEFLDQLRRLAREAKANPATPQERTTRGYKVRRHSPTLTAEERKAKEDMAIKLMAEAMKRKR